MNLPLQGQTAIVTGAGSATGIGSAIARHLLREGAFVAIGATSERIHETAKQLDPSGERVFPFVADLTEETRAEEVVGTIARRTGRVDILVNNAGWRRTASSLEILRSKKSATQIGGGSWR